MSRNKGHSSKPRLTKPLSIVKRAEGKSNALIARELRTRQIPIDQETVCKIFHEPEILGSIQGEYEAGLEGIREGIRQRLAEEAKAEQQRLAEWDKQWEAQARKDRERARELFWKPNMLTP
jgi:hypothetical protein